MGVCRPCWFALGARDSQPTQCTGHRSTSPTHAFRRCVRWHLWSDTGYRVGLYTAMSGSSNVAPGGSFLVRHLALPFLHGQFSAPSVVKCITHAYSRRGQLGSSLDLLCPTRV